MEAKRHNRKIDNHDDDRREVSSLRPPSRESSHDNSSLQSRSERRPQEHNTQTRMQGTMRPLTGSSNTVYNQSVEQEDLKVPGHIHIDDVEEEEKQDIVTSLPVRAGDGGEQHQQMYPGAVTVHGPEYASSEQSTAGTILVGDQIPGQNNGTLFISNEPSARENQDLVIAAVVAPTEANEVTRIDNEIERRVRDQFDRFLQQTPRAETVNLEVSANDDLNESVEEAAAFNEGVDVGATNEIADANISNMTHMALNKKHEGKGQNKIGSNCMHLETARKKRLVCLISILTVIIIIVVGITMAIFLSKSSGEEFLQCGSASTCNLDHADASCVNGQCVIDRCELNYEDCNSDANDGCEVNLQTDKNHCGSCNNKCDFPHANSKCVGQLCLIESCSVGFGNCDGNHGTGCETNLQTDKNNCGSCANICNLPNGISKCVEGECALDNCMDGYASCDDKSPNSCEVNLQTDKNHCGFCGNRCDLLNLDHADAGCTNGQCVIDKCELNYDDCNNDANDGCEVNLETDKNHCGSCNNKCDLPYANSKCVGLQCLIESCSVGFDDCDGKHETGCETNLQTDKNNCGSCANICNLPNGISKCVEGKCVLDNCMDGYASCNNESPNSCEVNLQTDKNHCGFCGNRCDLSNANSICVQGTCTVDACVPGYGDCDGKASTGCEVDLLSNEDHCGSCHNKCSTSDSCANGACVNLQRQALMSLYESTNGPNWDTDAQTNWGLPNVNECNWDGVTCTNGKVTDLGKWSDNLKGTIPTDIGLLTELTYLSLSFNELTGTLPSEMASLTKLTLLNLSDNDLAGTIPTEIGRLTNMWWISISTNQFIGTLPSEIASMTKLMNLYVYNNSLESIPSEICNMDLSTFRGDCPPCSLGCCTKCL